MIKNTKENARNKNDWKKGGNAEGRKNEKNKTSKMCENMKRVGVARGVMVTVVGNGHGDTSSNPGRDWLHFT